ncbi:MAG: aldehyde ferredoxin oxidoreductase, partial [Actinobacteria bacterium]|nr:aldehyde ferredoxin oxidoreductase [Actinomycetota bacterium]
MNSYTGRILRVDLTARRSRIESTREDWARLFVGGKGLGIRYLYEDLKPGTPPLSPENRLILMTGPLTGTLVPTSGKLAIITRSPATGTVLDCSIGGTIGNQIKHAGFDGIVLEGKASESIYLLIEDDRIRFIECPELRGKGSHHTELALRGKYGEGISVLSIGPAGENLCSFACITSEFYRQAGRGGVGAVMGSKNLKAIAVRGTRGFTLPDMDRFLSVGKDVLRADALSEANGWVYTDGTPMIVEMSNNTGILPTRNWQDGTFSGYEGLNSEAVKGVRERKKACSGCPLGCGNYIRAGKTSIEGPEYETLAIAGSNCGISDLEAVAEFNRRCDDLGLDSISSGATAAFAMELTEKGIHDFGLTFGDVRGYLEVPRLIAFREGIGAELSEGVRSMARKYGGAEFAS